MKRRGLFTRTLAVAALFVIQLQIAAMAGEASPNGGSADAPNTVRCYGTVVDAGGRPVTGATLEFHQYATSRTLMRGDMEIKARAVSGTNGAFDVSLPRSSTTVIARQTGFALAWAQWNPLRNVEQHLVMTPPSSLAGVVVDETDKPVADAEVFVTVAYSEVAVESSHSFLYLSGKPARDGFSARTGSDGAFRIGNFPTNAMADLGVKTPGRLLRETPRPYTGPDTIQFRAGRQDIKLVVEPASRIEGRVVREDGGPTPADTTLWLQGSGPGMTGSVEPARAAADGAFTFPTVAAGSYQVRAGLGTNTTADWVAEPVTVSVEIGQPTRDVKLTAVRGGLLEVTVVGTTDRKPIANGVVNAYNEKFQAAAGSDTNGMVLLRLPPGDYQVSAGKENQRAESTTATIEAGRTNRVQIELSPPPKIAGIVRNPDGTPAPGMTVKMFPEYGGDVGELKTDTNGRFEMVSTQRRYGPQSTTYCLIVRDVERNLAVAQPLEEGPATLNLQLVPALGIAGRVEGADGRPLTNASVRLYLWSGNMGSQFGELPKTDAQGRFEINALPPDRRYSLDATAKGYGSANQQIRQDDASTNRVELEPLVLRVADRQLAGQVVDAEGKPASGASVYMYGSGQPNNNARTDNEGRFRFDVCEGQINVSASFQQSNGSVRTEGGETNVVVTLGAASSSVPLRIAPSQRPALTGKPLPDLATAGLSTNTFPADKPVLLCLLDVEQRPSRRVARLLAEQHAALSQKGMSVAVLQAVVVADDAFNTWKETAPAPFAVGRLAADSDKAVQTLCTGATLPWLILTDARHRVVAEGFPIDELDAKVANVGKAP